MSEPSAELDTARAQAAAIRHRRGAPTTVPVAPDAQPARVYAGLVTRTLAFGLDAAVVNGVAALVAVVIGLGASLLHLPKQADTALAAIGVAAWVLWSVAYFGFFWSTTGQTPGDRIMGIQVVDRRGRGPLKPRRAVARFGFLLLAAIPLFAGILMMLWDERGRCLQDRLARTVVVYSTTPGTPST